MLVDVLVKAGADIIEIGFPFSDPIADGPTIQAAYNEALKNKVTPAKCLELVGRIRKKHPDLPIILMTYSNIVVREGGLKKFVQKSKEFGVDGFILPDMNIDEAQLYIKVVSKAGLATIFLASPNTKEIRLKSIIFNSRGFLYLITVFVVTGVQKSFQNFTGRAIRRVKRLSGTKIPVVVGFGISKPEHVRYMVDAGADGIVIASAIIDIIKANLESPTLNRKVEFFVGAMKLACNSKSS
jgi:tryptophan synthase alpha chain